MQQMENSRRSAPDRARELGLKKPRLSDDPADRHRVPNGERPFAPRDPRGRGGAQRLRPAEREREEKEEPARGAGSYQELVAQYKTAIAELTFNSKPIITNLTIIAGENLHAAKGIAATICNHIIEVPSDQKLPSLYLLDSIVKNIKGDYIRYFAAKLPEVFCKVYRQVDSSIHPSMRHLFGTWKTVFPAATLQIIEKELGFSTAINSSSGATASKPESQTTQRQPHSIHVNPKYLEERRRLQQLSKAKDSSSDDSSLVRDTERYDRGTLVGNTKQWTELPSQMPNIQRPQRENLHDPVHEKKGYKDVRDHDYSPELSRHSLDLGVRRVIEKVKERDAHGKPYYSTAGDGSEIPISRRNDFDSNQAYETYRPSGSAQTDYHPPSAHQNNTNKSSRPTPKNWKNSEEEEFMWDDMNSRLTNYGDTNSTAKGAWNNDDADRPATLQRGKWPSEHIESSLNKFDTLSQFRTTPADEDRLPLYRDIEEHPPQVRGQHGTNSRMKFETTADRFSLGRDDSEYQPSSVWPPREPHSLVGSVDHVSSRYSGQSEGQHLSRVGAFSTRPGPLSHAIPPPGDHFSGSAGIFGQGKQSLLSSSPRAQSPPSSVHIQHEKLHNSIDRDTLHSHSLPKMSEKPLQLPEQLNRPPQVLSSRDSFPSLSQGYNQQSLPSLSSPPERLESSSTSTSVTQTRHHHPLLQLSQPDMTRQTQASQLPVQIEKLPPLRSGPTQGHSPRHPNSSVDASGQLSTSNLLAAIMKSGLLPNNPASGILSQNVHPPLPSGPPPIQALASPASLATPSTLPFLPSHGKTPAVMPPITKAVLPPLPPGPPPASSQIASTSRANNNASSSPDPLSGLLSSLLAKGIISSPAKELPTVTSVQIPNKVPHTNISSESNASELVPPSSSTVASFPSSAKELNISEPSVPTATTNLDNLIGFEFKPEIIREFHPLVIGNLFDALKYQCSLCGLRFRLPEELHNHNDWHASKKSEISGSENVSRNWYTDKNNWTIGRVGPSCGSAAESLEELDPGQEESEEPMVPADENQSICALCGEPFDDFYSDERDEWMYKGTVYFGSARGQGDMGGMDESTGSGLIVHAKCLPGSVENMEIDGHS